MQKFMNKYASDILYKVGEHLYISGISVIIGSSIAIIIGVLISRSKRGASLVIGICSILQTIPSLALLAIMIPIFQVGKKSAIVALIIYSLLPTLRNTVIGMQSVDESVLDAAKGMGLNTAQQIFTVQLPLASSTILAGIRLSATYVITWATIAAYVGAGGLGDYIFTGLNNYNIELIIIGTLCITLLTITVDYLFSKLENKFSLTFESEGIK